ncbi:hypothetical protein ACH4UM_00870 [Streptomyces sp. NPDC020801]|uniref:hypothetical protein n=1 Tax=unclassified Streptomyces TaxID=2593676 RepID=UPI00379624E2
MRPSIRVPLLRLPLAAVLLAFCAAGCGTGGTGRSAAPSAADAVLRAAEKTERAASLRYRMTGRMPEQGRVRAEAVIGAEPPVARVRMTVLGGDQPGTWELRLADGRLYESLPGHEVRQAHGRHWIDFGPTAKFRTGGGMKLDVAGLRDQAGRNPAREAAFLAASDDVRRVGAETVEGVHTTHYSGTAGLDRLRAWSQRQDRTARERRGPSLDGYTRMGLDRLTLDVWVDDTGRVKRVRTQGFGRHGELDLTVTFYDYGRPVTVRAPAAGDAVDLRKPPGKPRG